MLPFHQRNNILWANVDDHVVALNKTHGTLHVLNASAGAVWVAINGKRLPHQIILHIASTLSDVPSLLSHDVMSTIESLAALDLITTTPSQQPLRNKNEDGNPTAAACKASHLVGPYLVSGTTVSIGTDDPEFHRQTESMLTDLPGATSARSHVHVDGPDRTGTYAVYLDTQRIGQAGTRDHALVLLITALNQAATKDTQDCLLLHAGAVEREGECIIVAGESGRGKSTLTAALVQDGWNYLTDEVVAIDAHDNLLTYPKPICLSDQSRKLVGLPNEDVPGKPPTSAHVFGNVSHGGRVRAIFVIGDQEAAKAEHIASPIDAIVTVVPQLFRETYNQPHALERIARLVKTVPVYKMGRRPLGEMVDAVNAISDR